MLETNSETGWKTLTAAFWAGCMCLRIKNYCDSCTLEEDDTEWMIVVERIFVTACPVQRVSETANNSIDLSFMVVTAARSCALSSLRLPKVQMFQQAILVLDFA